MKQFTLIVLIALILPLTVHASEASIWDIRSVDTMKTSRDLAREKLNDRSYDTVIERDLILIKNLGANYVAIDTPYDDQFLPYLRRWVKLARKTGLKVWFRGNFSSWEGWFDYPKNMTPQEHIRETAKFIDQNQDLFENGDAFDPCPECENAQWWPQPQKNAEYNQFVANQQVIMKASFGKIGKDVHTNWTAIIGGRAKEVLDKSAVNALDNIVAIDHYTTSVTNMDSYIKYFASSFGAKTLVSEFGAPIPDIHGKMSDKQQADFIDTMMNVFYVNKESVYGLNYFALGSGTTEIIDAKGNPKLAYNVIKKYYSPATVSGIVTDELGKKLSNITVGTSDQKSTTTTDSGGKFTLVVPAQNTTFSVENKKYNPITFSINIERGENIKRDVMVRPSKPTIIYKFRFWLKTKLEK